MERIKGIAIATVTSPTVGINIKPGGNSPCVDSPKNAKIILYRPVEVQ